MTESDFGDKFMSIHRVRLFAIARERAGRSVIEVELPKTPTVADLRAAIAISVPSLASLVPFLKFSVDAEYADDTITIPRNAELAAFPPVSGGQVLGSNR